MKQEGGLVFLGKEKMPKKKENHQFIMCESRRLRTAESNIGEVIWQVWSFLRVGMNNYLVLPCIKILQQ